MTTAAVRPMIERPRMIVAAMTTTMVLLVFDSSIVGVMLPSMRRELDLTNRSIPPPTDHPGRRSTEVALTCR